MNKAILLIITLINLSLNSLSQKFSVSPDKNNVFYIGVDNPITIAVENTSCKSLIVKSTNGEIEGKSGTYVLCSSKVGRADIIIYKKVAGHLKEIGRSYFRVKSLPDPVAKIGPSSGGNISKVILQNQEFIRAELEGFDFQLMSRVDSFTICIIRGDTCLYKEIKNIGGKLNAQVKNALSGIKNNDTVIFKKIFASGPDGVSKGLAPILLFITD